MVTVNDQNDQPTWTGDDGASTYSHLAIVYYRSIPQLQPPNTAVAVCSETDHTQYSCPVVEALSSDVEIFGYDEDFFSILTYSFVLGVGSAANYESAADNPFRINSCSGLISLQGNDQISFAQTKLFNFTIMEEVSFKIVRNKFKN